jgi:hypothetical protein
VVCESRGGAAVGFIDKSKRLEVLFQRRVGGVNEGRG